MRLHRLELEGFGPFRDRQEVDFDAFADDGIFLITGRTGAGKSSILDGVCFALYGDVPRYSGSDKRLRSDHCAPDDVTEVRLEFSLGDRRLRVTRSPEYDRPKRRGSGLTPVKQQAQLDELVQGRWVGRASGPRDVGLLLSEVLGLTREQFLQVILLAQGRFAKFLLAGNDERQAVLRTLFGTRRYEDYARALTERRKSTAEGVEKARVAIELLLAHGAQLGGSPAESSATGTGETLAIPAQIDALTLAADRARRDVEAGEAAVEQAQKVRAAAEADLAEGKRVSQAQLDLVAERAALAVLEADAPAMTAARAELVDASAAEALRAPLEVDVRRSAELVRARETVEATRAALTATGYVDAEADDTRLQAAIDEWIAQLASWQDAETLEQQLPQRRAELERLGARLDEARADRDRLDAEAQAGPERAAALDARIADASEAAGAEPVLAERIGAESAKLDAARLLIEAEQQVAAADAAYVAAAAKAEAAGGTVVGLLQQRLQTHAGELAAELRPGEPCAVCGSADHPHPARPAAEVITDETISAAEAERDQLRAVEGDAQRAAGEVREHRNELAERSGGASVAQIEQGLDALRRQSAVAVEARVRRDALVVEREQLHVQVAAAAQRRDALSERITELSSEQAAAVQRVRTAEQHVAEARGESTSVGARIAQTEARRAAAGAVVSAVRMLTVAEVVAADARADLDRRIAQSPFSDAQAATAALREAGTRERLQTEVASYDRQLATRRARLLELELQMLPVEPVDLARLLERHETADREYRDAVTRKAAAESGSRALTDVLARVRAQYAAVGPLVAEADRIAGLADAISGRGANTHRMTLEAFVLAAELEEIVEQANVRLDEMSSGRYRLLHTDARAARNAASGLGIEVMDAFTGLARPAASLSGGETFLASLALALGLADVVTARAGGIRLDTLFVDEGFGSLDSETLEIAMGTLETLRHGGRTIGVISHVEAMRDQLATQLRVTAGSHGPSRVEQGTPVGVP